MTDLYVIVGAIGAFALVFGFTVGHYHATAQFKALLAQIGPGLGSDLSAIEQEAVALVRKATAGKAPAAAVAGTVTDTTTTAGTPSV